jgi:hypothetical protein
MLPHPDSVIAFGHMRHRELQAENLQGRRAMAAVPSSAARLGLGGQMRFWAGAVLIRLGTALRAEPRELSAPGKAFPARAA